MGYLQKITIKSSELSFNSAVESSRFGDNKMSLTVSRVVVCSVLGLDTPARPFSTTGGT
jgi:hypothetical protein